MGTIRDWLQWAEAQERDYLCVWRRMADEGVVDEAGSVQYDRRYREWVLSGRPRPIRGWILGEIRHEQRA